MTNDEKIIAVHKSEEVAHVVKFLYMAFTDMECKSFIRLPFELEKENGEKEYFELEFKKVSQPLTV